MSQELGQWPAYILRCTFQRTLLKKQDLRPVYWGWGLVAKQTQHAIARGSGSMPQRIVSVSKSLPFC